MRHSVLQITTDVDSHLGKVLFRLIIEVQVLGMAVAIAGSNMSILARNLLTQTGWTANADAEPEKDLQVAGQHALYEAEVHY